jgi:hypothetical protein
LATELVVTAFAVTVKFAVLRPAPIVTVVGVVATAVLLDARAMTTPPTGAGAVRVAVAMEVLPPVTDAGLRVIEDRASEAGFIVSEAVLVTVFKVEEIITAVAAATDFEVTVNVALAAPAATATLAGTVAALVLLLVRVTVIPPAGAAEVNVTVPLEVPPAVSVVGFKAIAESSGADVELPILATNASIPPAFAA